MNFLIDHKTTSKEESERCDDEIREAHGKYFGGEI